MWFCLGCFVTLIIVGVIHLFVGEKKDSGEDYDDIYKTACSLPDFGGMCFQQFVDVNAQCGIKIETVKIERKYNTFSLDELWFYYKVVDSKATKQKK